MRYLDQTKGVLRSSRLVSYLLVGVLKIGTPMARVATQRATPTTAVRAASPRNRRHRRHHRRHRRHRRRGRYVRRFHRSLPLCSLALPFIGLTISLWCILSDGHFGRSASPFLCPHSLVSTRSLSLTHSLRTLRYHVLAMEWLHALCACLPSKLSVHLSISLVKSIVHSLALSSLSRLVRATTTAGIY